MPKLKAPVQNGPPVGLSDFINRRVGLSLRQNPCPTVSEVNEMCDQVEQQFGPGWDWCVVQQVTLAQHLGSAKFGTYIREYYDMSDKSQGKQTGSTYTNLGQAGAMGDHARSDGNTFNQAHAGQLEGIDLPALASELAALRRAIASGDQTDESATALGSVAQAEVAAKKGDASTVLHCLKTAGSWASTIAVGVGLKLAEKAILKAIGS